MDDPRPRYVPPTLVTIPPDEVRALLGPIDAQYVVTSHAGECLPLAAGDTVEDVWTFALPSAPARVRIEVDVADRDCAGPAWAACSGALDPAAGPLDPKLALYPPGVTPAPGPFNGFSSPQCGATPDTGCAPKPPDACIICDNRNCSEPLAAPGICGLLEVDLPQAGTWSLAVAAQAPGFVPQGQGCYLVTVTALNGATIGPLSLVADDAGVTFLK